MMSKYPVIAFDEAGNTGADLLNVNQPVFTLASVCYSIEEAESLLGQILVQGSTEAKFGKLKRSSAGQERLRALLASETIEEDRIKLSFFHKRYIVITKIVDLLIEPVAHRDGIDLYKDGANIAESNIHYNCMPVFCGQKGFDALLESFVKMIRKGDASSVQSFYSTAWMAYDKLRDEEYKACFAPILASEELIAEVLSSNDYRSLDPAIPGFVDHCARWGEQLGAFDLIHDSSKPLFAEKDMLELLMDPNDAQQLIGHDRRRLLFPLKSRGITFADSKSDVRLQVADLMASAAVFWANGCPGGRTDKKLWTMLDRADINRFTINALWPSTNVTPEEMGTDSGYGVNAADYIGEYLAQRRKES